MSMTSDERREVAARLRERPVARDVKESYVAIVQAVGVRPCLLSHEGESGDRFDAAAYADALDRLADLIDPTCSMEYGGHVPDSVKDALGVYFCSECGSPIYNDMEPEYCPYCGARVVGNGNE